MLSQNKRDTSSKLGLIKKIMREDDYLGITAKRLKRDLRRRHYDHFLFLKISFLQRREFRFLLNHRKFVSEKDCRNALNALLLGYSSKDPNYSTTELRYEYHEHYHY